MTERTVKYRGLRTGLYLERPLPATRTTAKSRCHYLGVKPNALARKAARFEHAVRQRAQLVAYEWNEVDNSVVGAVDDFLRALDVLKESINEAVQFLREPYDDR